MRTQVLTEPLQGPIYFVSYGSQKFPEAVIVLQGDNITVELHGETFIDHKTGITSATFRNTPDTPFESIEVNIPTGRYSEFGANLPTKNHYNFLWCIDRTRDCSRSLLSIASPRAATARAILLQRRSRVD